MMELKITPSVQTIVKPPALGPIANTDTKLLIDDLFQKGRVLAQDGVSIVTIEDVRQMFGVQAGTRANRKRARQLLRTHGRG